LIGRLFFALTVLLSVPALADWPAFRGGGELQGRADSTLSEKLKLLWSAKTGLAVVSSPAVVGGKVFVGSNDSKVYALDQATGKVIWTFTTEGPVESSPLVREGMVVIGSADSNLYALEAETGKLRWKYATKAKVLGAANASTLPDGKTVIVVGS